MPQKMTEDEMLALAQRIVSTKKSFYHNVAVYVLVNLLLAVIWVANGGGHPWFLWVSLFWGIALVFQGLKIFVFPKYGSNWEQKAIEEEMEKIRKQQQ